MKGFDDRFDDLPDYILKCTAQIWEGRYGRPTGSRIHVMGVSHVEFGPRGIRRDITLFHDIAIWQQILLHAGG
jgi:hypothetical protein